MGIIVVFRYIVHYCTGPLIHCIVFDLEEVLMIKEYPLIDLAVSAGFKKWGSQR